MALTNQSWFFLGILIAHNAHLNFMIPPSPIKACVGFASMCSLHRPFHRKHMSTNWRAFLHFAGDKLLHGVIAFLTGLFLKHACKLLDHVKGTHVFHVLLKIRRHGGLHKAGYLNGILVMLFPGFTGSSRITFRLIRNWTFQYIVLFGKLENNFQVAVPFEKVGVIQLIFLKYGLESKWGVIFVRRPFKVSKIK